MVDFSRIFLKGRKTAHKSNPFDWEMQQRVYKCCLNNVNELKQRLIDVWNVLQQNVVDSAVNE